MTGPTISDAVGERNAIVAWLDRRAEMANNSTPRWNLAKRLKLRAMSGTFSAAARLVERGAHHASLKDETAMIAAALRARAATGEAE